MVEIEKCFVSWSGGKDSCLSLYKAIKCGFVPKFLLSMCIENGERNRSHGLSTTVIKEQAKSIGITLLSQNTTWQNYRKSFLSKIYEMKRQNINMGVFGDIDIEEHIAWEQKIYNDAGIKSYFPLAGEIRKKIINEFLLSGFQAKIVAIDATKLSPKYLGVLLTHEILNEFESLGIDSCGENGEYHTVVISGPIFVYPIKLYAGTKVLKSGYWFQDFFLKK